LIFVPRKTVLPFSFSQLRGIYEAEPPTMSKRFSIAEFKSEQTAKFGGQRFGYDRGRGRSFTPKSLSRFTATDQRLFHPSFHTFTCARSTVAQKCGGNRPRRTTADFRERGQKAIQGRPVRLRQDPLRQLKDGCHVPNEHGDFHHRSRASTLVAAKQGCPGVRPGCERNESSRMS